MAAIHDLLKQIADPKLRERIAREWEEATRHKKFGLVYEQHLPEVVPLYSAKPRRGDLVAKRGGSLTETWRVRKIEGGTAHLMKPRQAGERESIGDRITLPVPELLVVKQFGDPIYPTLVPIDAVQNGPADAPWHTLIEADNYHALQLLEYLYAGMVDCIYIDPPYNTGSRDWKYNNDYVDSNDEWRHSKWLSFMEKRLELAKKLLNPLSSVLVVTIDKNELHHLGILLAEKFPSALRQIITICINPSGSSGDGFSRVEEYALVCFVGNAAPSPVLDDGLTARKIRDEDSGSLGWESLLRRGNAWFRKERPNLCYPVILSADEKKIVGVGDPLPFHEDSQLDLVEEQNRPLKSDDGLPLAWPVRTDGRLGIWRVDGRKLQALAKRKFAYVTKHDKKRGTWTVRYLMEGAVKKIDAKEMEVVGEGPRGEALLRRVGSKTTTAKTMWVRGSHTAGGSGGTGLLNDVLGQRDLFSFPKSIYAVADTIRATIGGKKDALIVDFFSGSGTTLNAINLLNAIDEGERRCIMVTNNEVSGAQSDTLRESGHNPGDVIWETRGICRSVTWPRSKFTVLGRRDDGTPLTGEYLTGVSVDGEKRRTFRHAAFVSPEDFRMPAGLSPADGKKAEKALHNRKLAFVGMIDALPQNSVTPGCRFIVAKDHEASVLFDPEAAEEWLSALEEQDHISDFYIVAEDDKQFKALKAQVDDLLGPLIVQVEEKRPMSAGFPANVAYFKLDFLDKDRVELGAAFREVLPLLWMKAGAIGPAPTLPNGPLPDFFLPEVSPFAVLLNETRVAAFQQALQERKQLRHIFIVTDAEEAFRALSADLRSSLAQNSPDADFVQLYRDYLVNFTINTRADSAAFGQGGAA